MSVPAEQNPADGSAFLAGGMRIDPPHAGPLRRPLHVAGERLAMEPALVENDAYARSANSVVEHSLDQLREHAAQLADRLQGEQSAIDRRQSELAAQEADLEAKWENARQWLTERQQELESRAESVAAREQDIAEREVRRGDSLERADESSRRSTRRARIAIAKSTRRNRTGRS